MEHSSSQSFLTMAEQQAVDRVAVFSHGAPAEKALHRALNEFLLPGQTAPNDVVWLDRALEVARFLDQNPRGLVMVLLTHPVRRFAASLQADQALPQGGEACVDEMRAVVELLKTDRRRVFLVDADEAQQSPSALGRALRDFRGIDFPHLNDLAPALLEHVSEDCRAQALVSVAKWPEARRLNNEIEASLLPLASSGKTRSKWISAIDDLVRLEPIETRALEQDALAAELTDLKARFTAVEADFAVVAKTEATMSRRNLRLLKEIAALENARDQLEASREKIAKELERARQDVRTAEARTRDLKETVNALHASTSWRITAPMRVLKLAFSGFRQGRS